MKTKELISYLIIGLIFSCLASCGDSVTDDDWYAVAYGHIDNATSENLSFHWYGAGYEKKEVTMSLAPHSDTTFQDKDYLCTYYFDSVSIETESKKIMIVSIQNNIGILPESLRPSYDKGLSTELELHYFYPFTDTTFNFIASEMMEHCGINVWREK